jgi:hypothetical protein
MKKFYVEFRNLMQILDEKIARDKILTLTDLLSAGIVY